MTPSRFLKGFFASFVIFVAGDIVWHGILMADFYNARIMAISGLTPEMVSPCFILVFEFIASLILTYFVLAAAKHHTVSEGMKHGLLLGLLVAVGINFVAHSLIPKWDVAMVAVDTIWGTIMGGIAGAAIAAVTKKKHA